MPTLCTLLAIAVCRPPAQVNLANDRFVTFLPSGTAVRILAVTNYSGQIWSPNGESLDSVSAKAISKDWGLDKGHKGDGVVIFFEVLPLNPKRDVGVTARYVGTSGGSYTHLSVMDFGEAGGPRKHCGYISYSDPNGSRAQIDIGVAEAPFKPLLRSMRSGQEFRSVLGPEIRARVRQLSPDVYYDDKVRKERIGFRLNCQTPELDEAKFEYRLALYNRDGSDVGDGGGSGGPGIVEMDYSGLAKNLGRIEVQTRPYVWTSFTGIRLRPNQ